MGGRNLEDLWENLLRAVEAFRLAERGGVLIHGCAVASKGGVVLCPGVSGAGKSTFAAMFRAAGRSVFSDDCVALFPDSEGDFLLQGLPFGGDFRPRMSSCPPVALSAVLVLEKASCDCIKPLSPAWAAAVLIRCAPFVNGDPYPENSCFGRKGPFLFFTLRRVCSGPGGVFGSIVVTERLR